MWKIGTFRRLAAYAARQLLVSPSSARELFFRQDPSERMMTLPIVSRCLACALSGRVS
jgi:hypothetical protein